ncbi:ribonuclease P protein component [Alcanivorax sp. 1008]|uniref:ribonuclease P protein component n=1 Tax=Alcanivorax sp. 1008 TaxID=2816853 RepID=UPI001DD39F84|nr:ribonuclease P protein component [Alcanivorax sp. 1008]MCC1496173.1 ribonuclease P protein component [Alcanivorax sp. 1008]
MNSPGSRQFPRSHRLLSPSEFKPLFDNPQWRASSQHFLLLVSENGLAAARLGIVIGKRRVKRAVDRNLLRRLMRESFRHLGPELAGLDIVILVRANIDHPEKAVFTAQLAKVWSKLLAKRAAD